MNIVIGSGPAGVACAYALLKKGKEVLLVDAGIQLEPQQQELLAALKTGENTAALAELKTLQNNQRLSSKGLHTKLTYGSDFPYRGTLENLNLKTSGTGMVASLATGGLSNVWGAAALPYMQKDISDWPITTEDLAAHYKEILKVTGLSAKEDDLADLFPLYTDAPNDLKPSSQANHFLQDLESLQSRLKNDGIRYGSSRLMVGPNPHNKKPCVYCGECIYGCPFGCIYNSGDDFMGLLQQRQPQLQYRPNTIVTNLKEEGSTVTVSGFDRLTKEPVTLQAERVFLAAGAIPTTRIILKSLNAYNTSVDLKDSQYFLFPLISIKGHPEATREMAYTLSQIFFEIQDEEISPNTVHLQFYTYNDVITKTLEHKLWFLPLLRNLLIRFLEHRIIIVQGYLHSRHSGKVRLNLSRDMTTGKESLHAEGIQEIEAKTIISKILKKIGKHFIKLGIFPIAFALEFCLPGRGFHCGGSFPMKTNPGPLESDIYGRVGGASRIHVVDASIFPTIPATTITFTAMANAHRIGSQDY
jgi:choline dehydrogenase-like flavoprotein